jgi:hypothetical protein
LARGSGSASTQPLQPMNEDAGASTEREWRCEHEASATCPGARSSHIAEETLHGVPPGATERELLEQTVAQPSRCTAVSNLPSATGLPVQGRGSHLPRNQSGLCNRAPAGGCSHRSCCRHYAAIGTVSNETPECPAILDNPNMVRQARWRWSQPRPPVLPTCEAPQRHASHSFVARLRAAGMPVPTRLERRSCAHRSCSRWRSARGEVSRPGVHWFVPRGRAPKTRARRPSA